MSDAVRHTAALALHAVGVPGTHQRIQQRPPERGLGFVLCFSSHTKAIVTLV